LGTHHRFEQVGSKGFPARGDDAPNGGVNVWSIPAAGELAEKSYLKKSKK